MKCRQHFWRKCDPPNSPTFFGFGLPHPHTSGEYYTHMTDIYVIIENSSADLDAEKRQQTLETELAKYKDIAAANVISFPPSFFFCVFYVSV